MSALLIFVYSLIVLLVPPQNAYPESDWKVLNEGFIRIQYHAYDSDIADLVFLAIKKNFDRTADMVGYGGPPIANIIISGSEDEYNQFTGNIMPKWSQGSTNYEKSRIVLKSPSFTGSGGSELTRTVIHELTHFLIGAVAPPSSIPRWFNEGTAMYLGGGETFRSKINISSAIHTNSIISLNEIEYVMTFSSERANLAYAESRAALEYLIEINEESSIKMILAELYLNKSFDSAFTKVTGIDLIDFEIEFRTKIRQRYRYYFLAAAADYIWFLIPGLFILAYLAVKLRNWQTIRRWRVEEEQDEFE
ncbi:MAG: hypothetical protein IIB40_03925 [Candidatus Marinimicrobia bacterium]|nr:hypothetical protein [Candidatus Neomarinimicrobiota bacterium]